MSTKTIALKNIITRRIKMQDIVYGISAVGLGLSLPHIFHTFGLGSAFLPMYLPILVLGILSPLSIVAIAATITPLFSYLISGMPPMSPPIAIVMIFQLNLLGILGYYFHQQLKMNIYLTIISVVLIERSVALLFAFTFLHNFISVSNIYSSYPGILLQIIGGIILCRLLKK